ncbi:hypothetical protein SAMN05720382_106119 [Polaromonas sp. JS666]|nr:hypothetical protein SAMN05720382_106119 [Polaromonas sp. JS666]
MFPALAPAAGPFHRKNRRETVAQVPFAAFHTPMSGLPEPLRMVCITSCKFCITFDGNCKVTRAYLLKMNSLADPWKAEKQVFRPLF